MAIFDVIRYNGNPDVFAWKYPNDEIVTGSQLIVHETQEAILLKGGQACEVFQAGRYTLETENLPVIGKLLNIPFGGHSPFSAEVWFVNKRFSLEIKWGTSTPIQLQDPKYHVFVPIRSFGQFGIVIRDSVKFLLKLVGNMPLFDKSHISDYFRGVYLTRVKDAISSYLIYKKISVMEINAYLDEISEYMKKRIEQVFDDYGIMLTSFYVNDINVPENDPAVQQLKRALAKKAEMDIVGYNYQQERSFDTMEGAARNPSSMQGGLMGAGIGLGMGAGLGGALRQHIGGIFKDEAAEKKICPGCSKKIDANSRFCNHCGCDTETMRKNDSGIKCASCGAQMEADSKFCAKCGKKYTPCMKCKADLPVGATVCPSCGEKAPRPCPNCGKLLSPGSRFCTECGYTDMKKCTGCGMLLEKDVKFCPECGTAAESTGTGNQEQDFPLKAGTEEQAECDKPSAEQTEGHGESHEG